MTGFFKTNESDRIHFNPEGTWTDELIVRYTENWFAKSMEIDLQNPKIHEEFS